jgi:hypothetical protein
VPVKTVHLPLAVHLALRETCLVTGREPEAVAVSAVAAFAAEDPDFRCDWVRDFVGSDRGRQERLDLMASVATLVGRTVVRPYSHCQCLVALLAWFARLPLGERVRMVREFPCSPAKTAITSASARSAPAPAAT